MNNEYVRLLIFLTIIISQWTLGYHKLKKMGFVIPVVFYIWVFTMIVPHLYKLTWWKAPILLVLLVALGGILYSTWRSGYKEKEKKISKEIEKMKAQDMK